MSALLDLAERCEAATGPDRELDDAIFAVMGLCKHRNTRFEASDDPEELLGPQVCVDCGQRGSMTYRNLPYTASLDAAMALVPEGFRKEVRDSDARGVWAYLFSGTEPADYIEEGATTVLNPHYGQGVTWSLALCAAALRARAAEQSALNREGGNG